MRFLTRKIALFFAWNVRKFMKGRNRDLILYQIAAVYGAADLYGYITAGKYFLASAKDFVMLFQSNLRRKKR